MNLYAMPFSNTFTVTINSLKILIPGVPLKILNTTKRVFKELLHYQQRTGKQFHIALLDRLYSVLLFFLTALDCSKMAIRTEFSMSNHHKVELNKRMSFEADKIAQESNNCLLLF
jgi:hypothetical protein